MPLYFGEFVRQRTSPGLILVTQKLSLGAAIEDVVLLWNASGPNECVNQIFYLPI